MDGVDLKKIEKKMNGASGAELKAVCTEAGMFALRERRVHVTKEDFEIAVGKVMMEVTKKNMSSYVQSHSSSRSGPLSAHHRHSAAHPGPSSARPGLQADLLGLSLPPSGY
ncbi:hypothetical protein D8674_014554 [Pyrus ussuriensis x Pyrus communis]|uniref:AAA ATPase AAA+ lid domain-containing protein n=1 Tax=Pyrus ussuriensis x Pyrus communis TaxID=2448454 RepID=A0A5N5GSW1_9ROSA|nr:hypothetical protein D8674_014554 [Pyrus ussuriensis x Pyrus communis]